MWLALLSCLAEVGVTASGAAKPAAPAIERLEIEGNARTRESTLGALLPRSLPTVLDDEEVEEVERRIRNLEIFDAVEVTREGAILRVRVREKHTLIPSLELSTGRTLADTFIAVGVTEYNLLGTASGLNLSASWAERGPNAAVGYWQHPYAPRRWAWGAEAGYATAFFQFDDGPPGSPPSASPSRSWERRQIGGSVEVIPPFSFEAFLRLTLGAGYLRELVANAVGSGIPPGGHWIAGTLTLARDRYVWDDLVPSGYLIELEVVPGVVVPSGDPRHQAELAAKAALPLGGRTVIGAHMEMSGVAGGNVNHSVTLGSLEGVRGLADTYYRNRRQGFANLELRSAVKLAERWALQGVAFGDVALFEQMDAAGRVSPWAAALAAGVGVRVIPTALAELLLRVDVARLLLPQELWFVQVGLNQYF